MIESSDNMADINLNDYDTFNERVGSLDNNEVSMNNAKEALDILTYRIKGERSISKIRNEIYNFLYANPKMNADIKSELMAMADGNYIDGLTLSNDVLNFLEKNYSEKEEEYAKNKEEIEDMKTDFVNRVETELNDSKVGISGNLDDVKEEINNEGNIASLNHDVDDVRNMLKDNKETYSLTTDDLVEAINKPEDEVLQNKIADQTREKVILNINEDGTVEFKDDLLNKDNKNYMAMMLAGLTASDMNLDMYLSKKEDDTQYKVIFGDLPIKEENRLSTEKIDRIQKISDSYQSNINYQEQLSSINPAIGSLNEIVFDEMKKEGTFKVGINNRQGNNIIGLNLSEEYQHLTDALNTNGALTTNDNNEKSVVRVSGDLATQTTILDGAKLTLVSNKEKQAINNYQYVKKMELPVDQAARVSPSFLIVVAIMEVILIGFYLVITFN